MTLPLTGRDASPLDQSNPEQFTKESILRDYRIAFESRAASLIGEKQVFTGKAKFGIFGAGKEVAQVALARAFRRGDFRSGYYRDQTLMFALGLLTLEEFFAQLYAIPDVTLEPCSAGRSMTAHFGTCLIGPAGRFQDLAQRLNSSSDVSPTGSQMPRLVGLAYASKLYRELPDLQELHQFSHHGDEVAFGTIGNASCAEGMFWEAINAGGVLGIPMLVSIWDDGYGISVPNEYQITKGDLSAVLSGFRRNPEEREGYDLYTVQGWDYPGLCETYLNAAQIVRKEHVPAIVHVTELTQPQGHSTSGSHRRYKSAERLAWEEEHDGLRKMREWIIAQGIATADEMEKLEKTAAQRVRDAQQRAWEAFLAPIEEERRSVLALTGEIAQASRLGDSVTAVEKIRQDLQKISAPQRRDLMAAIQAVLVATTGEEIPAARRLLDWKREQDLLNQDRYSSDLYSTSPQSALNVRVVPAVYAPAAPEKNGFEIINACFDAALRHHPDLIALGEDVGRIGDVNQGFAGLQAKYGPLRVTDTGIRETTIIGQAIGMAMRGLRPVAEIQYLDYILYALQILSDDLATLRWRTKGQQAAPVIVRTRGHRLEGIWHSGSLMAGIIHLVRGIYVCVPRNMTQAAGMYNTLLQSDDPAIVVEVLNGYRLKEKLPANIGEMTVPLGIPDVLREGKDVTIATYGACCRVALEAAERLAQVGIDVEILDVQTLLPFDLPGRILQSLQKTNRILFLDEDVPGGTSGYMLREVLEVQGGYTWLDSAPRTLSGKEHRPAYGSDGDYWSKPNRETVFEAVYEMMQEANPRRFPGVFR
ncbi:MAG TPA: thiamine pyrophosphate-dependent enzyme [Thermoanaerobaculia bacterium]|nr:thiamine pyrophosphate-dependent enzyme [Thermoanaerobaculia bacterium]